MRSQAATLAFVTVEALLFVGAGLAALGAALVGLIALRKTRRPGAGVDEERRRRAPSPSSVGLADDPIVTALRAREGHPRRRRTARHVDSSDPPT